MMQENEQNSIAVAPYFCMPAPKWIFFTAQQTAKLHMWIVECFCRKTHSFPNMWILDTMCHSLIINDLDGCCIVFDTKKNTGGTVWHGWS